MNLKCETILDLYTHGNKKVLCQIKVLPSKSRTCKNSCRFLTVDQWKIFDKELEKLIDGLATTDDWGDEKCRKFLIEPNIEVMIQKSRLSPKYFYRCLSLRGDGGLSCAVQSAFEGKGNIGEIVLGLDCVFDLHQATHSITPTEDQEYKPQHETSSDKTLRSPPKYKPYTPTKKKFNEDVYATCTSSGDLFESNEDAYSPKPLFETNMPSPQTIPEYKPGPIKVSHSPKDSDKYTRNDYIKDIIDDSSDEILSPQKYRALRLKTKEMSKTEIEYVPKYHETTFIDAPAYIPTPIEEKVTTASINDSSSRIKTRSQTIDELPASFSILNTEVSKETLLESVGNFTKTTACANKGHDKKRSTERSKSVDVMPALLITNVEKPKSKTTQQECVDKKNLKKLKYSECTSSHNSKENQFGSFSLKKGKQLNSGTKYNMRAETLHRTSYSSEDEFLPAYSNSKSKPSFKSYYSGSDDEFEDVNKINKSGNLQELNSNANNLNASLSPGTESSIASTPQSKIAPKSKNPKNLCELLPLRRSKRSPNKPRRYVEEQNNGTTKLSSKKHKISPKNKELFGTDDDEDDGDFENNGVNNINVNKTKEFISKTPVSKKHNSDSSSPASSSTLITKRKRDKSSECQQEKRDLSKWLSKKKPSSSLCEGSASKESTKTSTTKLSTTSSTSKPIKKGKQLTYDVGKDIGTKSGTAQSKFDIPTKEELEEMRNKTKLKQKENEKLKAELDKMRTSPPKEVENLSLQEMPLNDILDTFSRYKSDLDEIFEKNRKVDYIKGHDGINHCFVIRLLQQNVQMKMLQKLTDVYSNGSNTTRATLFANALLPEWIIRVYMEKFNFTRQQAIDQIKAQDDYQLHVEAQSDISFMFD